MKKNGYTFILYFISPILIVFCNRYSQQDKNKKNIHLKPYFFTIQKECEIILYICLNRTIVR